MTCERLGTERNIEEEREREIKYDGKKEKRY